VEGFSSDEYLRRYKEIDEHVIDIIGIHLLETGCKTHIFVKIDCPDGTEITVNSQKSKILS
jgi:hypothetical protein